MQQQEVLQVLQVLPMELSGTRKATRLESDMPLRVTSIEMRIGQKLELKTI